MADKDNPNLDALFEAAFSITRDTAGNASEEYLRGWSYAAIQGNYTEAVKWYLKAAEHGHLKAQYNLACYYYNGMGIEQNYAEAVKWWRKAADQGLAQAQYNLGICYSQGNGVLQNYSEAICWLRKAAEQGYADAQTCLNSLGIK